MSYPDALDEHELLEIESRFPDAPGILRLVAAYRTLRAESDARARGAHLTRYLATTQAAANVLRRHGIRTVQAVTEMSEGDFLRLQGAGQATLEHLRDLLVTDEGRLELGARLRGRRY